MNQNETGSAEETSYTETGEATLETTAMRRAGERGRSRLVSGWRFTRHLLEVVVAMVVGMLALGLTIGVLGEPPGYANLLVRYGLVCAFMATPMVARMRYWDHSWRDGGETPTPSGPAWAARSSPTGSLTLLI